MTVLRPNLWDIYININWVNSSTKIKTTIYIKPKSKYISYKQTHLKQGYSEQLKTERWSRTWLKIENQRHNKSQETRMDQNNNKQQCDLEIPDEAEFITKCPKAFMKQIFHNDATCNSQLKSIWVL